MPARRCTVHHVCRVIGDGFRHCDRVRRQFCLWSYGHWTYAQTRARRRVSRGGRTWRCVTRRPRCGRDSRTVLERASKPGFMKIVESITSVIPSFMKLGNRCSCVNAQGEGRFARRDCHSFGLCASYNSPVSIYKVLITENTDASVVPT